MIEQSRPLFKKSDFNYIDEIIRSGQIARGKFVDELQNEFCKIFGIQFSSATSSGTTALHLALVALGISEGDEVIVPSYACTALLSAVNYVFATPVIADIDPETFNLTHNTIKKKITKKTKAVIITHTFGFPADLNEILKLGISLIEDCAQAIGSIYKGKPVGLTGKISVFSMYATKIFTAGEGGMVCTNDKKIAETIQDLNDPDRRNVYRVRYNYKMSDLAAGLALSQLRNLGLFIKCRKSIAKQYKNAFSLLPIKFQRVLPETVPSYYRFIICTSRADDLINFAQTQGVIFDRPIYKPLHRYLNINDDSSFTGTDLVWKNAVSIPIYPALKDSERSKIISTLKNAFTGRYGR